MNTLDVLCAQHTRDLFAIAKFLLAFILVYFVHLLFTAFLHINEWMNDDDDDDDDDDDGGGGGGGDDDDDRDVCVGVYVCI